MDFLQILFLAFIQGVTEFLPVSSSAHLILLPPLLGWQHHGLAFDLAVHFGSLLAVCGYFRHELMLMIKQWMSSPLPNKLNQEAYLVWKVIIATLPLVVIVYLFRGYVDSLRTPLLIAFGMIVFAFFLMHSDRYQQRLSKSSQHLLKNEYQLSMTDALIIGLSQVIAIIPGTSRSGITMTAAMYCKVDRVSAARFSFLLSIPTIFLGFVWQCIKVMQHGLDLPIASLLMAIALSAFFAWITIYYFLKLIQTIKLDVFVAYRIILGGVIVWLFI